MEADLMIIVPTALQEETWKREVPNVRVVGALQSTLGLRPRVVLMQQDNLWQRWEANQYSRKRLEDWFKCEVASRLHPGAFFARVTTLDVMAVKKIVQLLHDHPDDVDPARGWIEKNLAIVGADPHTFHRMLNAIRNVERYAPGIELSIREDNVPAEVLARRVPKHIVVPTDLDDHFIPDAELEGIVPRPKRS